MVCTPWVFPIQAPIQPLTVQPIWTVRQHTANSQQSSTSMACHSELQLSP